MKVLNILLVYSKFHFSQGILRKCVKFEINSSVRASHLQISVIMALATYAFGTVVGSGT